MASILLTLFINSFTPNLFLKWFREHIDKLSLFVVLVGIWVNSVSFLLFKIIELKVLIPLSFLFTREFDALLIVPNLSAQRVKLLALMLLGRILLSFMLLKSLLTLRLFNSSIPIFDLKFSTEFKVIKLVLIPLVVTICENSEFFLHSRDIELKEEFPISFLLTRQFAWVFESPRMVKSFLLLTSILVGKIVLSHNIWFEILESFNNVVASILLFSTDHFNVEESLRHSISFSGSILLLDFISFISLWREEISFLKLVLNSSVIETNFFSLSSKFLLLIYNWFFKQVISSDNTLFDSTKFSISRFLLSPSSKNKIEFIISL